MADDMEKNKQQGGQSGQQSGQPGQHGNQPGQSGQKRPGRPTEQPARTAEEERPERRRGQRKSGPAASRLVVEGTSATPAL
jgi:hypothetical protein